MAINKDYEAARYETETFGVKCYEALKIFGTNLLLFVMTLYAVTLYAFLGRKIILIGVFCCVASAILSYIMVPSDRPQMIIDIKKEMFIYIGSLIGGYFIIRLLNGIDASQIGVSIGLNAGQTQSNAVQGSLGMIIQFLMVMTPIGLIGNELKRIAVYIGFGLGSHVTKRKRMEQLQKTITK